MKKQDKTTSFLFMINSESVKVRGRMIEVDKPANVILFSDRPYRIAKALENGIEAFANFFGQSDFTSDPPNVTFSGVNDDGNHVFFVFELGTPIQKSGSVLFPIIRIIGNPGGLQNGRYADVSLVVDSVFGAIIGAITSAIGSVGLVGAIAGGAAAGCWLTDVATVGILTPACVAATAGVIATTGTALTGGVVAGYEGVKAGEGK